MPPPSLEPTRRFSDRADDYTRARPGYPDALADALAAEAELVPGSVVADVGSGTGISSELLLRRGCTVFGVEPNAEMRRAAERALGDRAGFRSVDGTAEATTLPDASVDLVTVAQAFHWLDPEGARREFARILRPGGRVALFWNWRHLGGTPFMDAYEALLRRFGTDYGDVLRRWGVRQGSSLASFFGGPYVVRTFAHAHALDLDGVRSFLRSLSYMPAPGHPDYEPMLRELERIVAAHARDGRVEMVYDAELHVGALASRPPRPEEGPCSR